MYIELKTQLEILKKDMKEIKIDWEGKERAEIASDIIERVKELETLLANLEDF